MNECTPEEAQTRLETCKQCEHFTIEENFTTSCAKCRCTIGFLIYDKDQNCPEGNW